MTDGAMDQTHLERLPARMRRSVVAVLGITVLLATLVTFWGAQRYFERLEGETATTRMGLYLRSLNETLRRHQHLPFVLARDPRYAEALATAGTWPDLNDRLALLAAESELEAIYLMDTSGQVQATSNADEPHSFLGQNYGFRPYFQEALNGARSDYFAIGATSGRPGYFVAEPLVAAAGHTPGVVAIKLDVSELQRSWESNTEVVVARNQDGIVVLASDPDWLYRPTETISPQTRQSILDSRQFGNEPLDPLAWSTSADSRVTVDGARYLIASGQSDWRGWTVHYLQPEGAILRQTLLATAFFGSIIALLVGFATFLRSRRIGQAYAASERHRSQLIATNHQLEEAQTELARNAKLAALGHLAASVTHELGQPISAFRNHLTAAEIGGEITSPQTASSLNRLVDRMEAITTQFRHFASGRTATKAPVDLRVILAEASALVAADTVAAGVQFTQPDIADPITVHAHQVQLEQAFTNLFKNAIHAVGDVDAPIIEVAVSTTPAEVHITVHDNGPGLGDATLATLQEPFYSTKPSGVGMGLGLSITSEIIRDHGGNLRIETPTEGATFVVTLPRDTTKKAGK